MSILKSEIGYVVSLYYLPATTHSNDTTDKPESESVWSSLMRKRGAPVGLKKAPGPPSKVMNTYLNHTTL